MEQAHDVRAAGWVTRVTEAGIARVCGVLAYERGLGYVDAERVASITTGDQGRLLLAVVSGARPRPYSTMVTATGSDDVYGEPAWFGRCSCPMQTACKHVAAVILTAREALAAPQPAAGWQQSLDLALARGERAGAGHADERHPYALAVSLASPLPDDEGGVGRRVIVRPTRRTRAGGWHRSHTWSDIAGPRGYDQLGDERQAELLRGIALLSSGVRWSTVGVQMSLDHLSPAIWPMLQRAIQAGILLIPDEAPQDGHQSLESVELVTDGASLALDVHEDESGARIAAVVHGAEPDERVLLLGKPAHGVGLLAGGRLRLAGLRDQPDALTVSLVGSDPVIVPSGEVEEFRSFYLPELRRLSPTLQHSAGDDDVADPGLRLMLVVSPSDEAQVAVEPHFAYGSARVPVALTGEQHGRRRRRDERALVERAESLLRPLGLVEPIGGLGWWPVERVDVEGLPAVRLVRALDELAAHDDIVVEIVGDLPSYEQATAEPLIEVGTAESDNPDWFDLHVTVSIEGETVPFEPLFQAMVRGQEFMVLHSGTYFRLDHPSLHRLRDLIGEARELLDVPGKSTQLNRFQVGLWQELVDLGVVGEQAQVWQESVERLRQLDKLLPPDPPRGLAAELRPYQQDGYAWLTTLWDSGLGGILADDMGLGKTLQALATFARARELGELGGEAGAVLVVAPTSVVGTWVSEAARFAPDLVVRAVGETSRKRAESVAELAEGVDLVVTSYAVLRLDADEFRAVPWRGLVLDEAQAVKNHQAKTYQAVRRLAAPFRLAISGTPLENSLMDLWSLLSITAPGLYPSPEDFTQRYRRPIESGWSPELLDQVRRRIRPLMMRRTKDEVAADLPEKQIQVSQVGLSPVHARIYDQHLQRERQRVLGLLDDPDANRVAILASLTRLRQLALDPALVDDAYVGGTSAKIQTLVEQLREVSAEGHRALVFSQFTRYLRMAESALTKSGLETCYLDGSMTAAARTAEVDAFKAGRGAAFLISLKAGGTGLTLTEADYVFVLDPWWNPAVEAQAIDRAHRIGQDKPVMVYRLVSRGTIEDKVVALQDRKRALFDRVLGDGGALSGALSPEDIKGLLDL